MNNAAHDPADHRQHLAQQPRQAATAVPPPQPRWQQYRINNNTAARNPTDGAGAPPFPPADVAVDRRPFECLERLARVNTAHFQRAATAAVAAGTLPTDTHPNSNVPATEPIGVFHTTAAVDVPLHVLVTRLCRETASAPAVGLLGLLLVIGVLERTPGAHVTENMTARMLVAGVRVASKFIEDRIPSGEAFAAAAGIVPRELMRLESTLLHGLDWRVLTAFGDTGGIAATASVAMLEDDASDRIMALATADPAVRSLQHADLRSAPGTPLAPGLCANLDDRAAFVVSDGSNSGAALSSDHAYGVVVAPQHQTATSPHRRAGGAGDERDDEDHHHRGGGSHRSSSSVSGFSRGAVATPMIGAA